MCTLSRASCLQPFRERVEREHTQCARNAQTCNAQRNIQTRNAHIMHIQCTHMHIYIYNYMANAIPCKAIRGTPSPSNLSRFRFHISARSLSGERLPRTPTTSPACRRYALGFFASFCFVIVFVCFAWVEMFRLFVCSVGRTCMSQRASKSFKGGICVPPAMCLTLLCLLFMLVLVVE